LNRAVQLNQQVGRKELVLSLQKGCPVTLDIDGRTVIEARHALKQWTFCE
jgi:hypothetical protein